MVSTSAPSSCKREHGARLDRLAVDMHDAGAALRGVAADMRAGEPQLLAQQLHQQGARIDFGGDGLAVHRHGNGDVSAPFGLPWGSSSKNSGQMSRFAGESGSPAKFRGEIGAFLPFFVPWNDYYSEPQPRRRSRAVPLANASPADLPQGGGSIARRRFHVADASTPLVCCARSCVALTRREQHALPDVCLPSRGKRACRGGCRPNKHGVNVMRLSVIASCNRARSEQRCCRHSPAFAQRAMTCGSR